MTARRLARALAILGLLVGLAAAGWLAADVRTPDEVPWEAVVLQGLPADRAEGLVLQVEDGDDVWGTRGYSLYRSREGGPFHKVFTLRPRFGEAWGGFLATLRRRFGYQELVELLPVAADRVVAFAGGDVYRVDLTAGTQERVHTLRYFGRGQGRGVMAHGLTRDGRGALYYGEYPTHIGGAYTVRVWRSEDEGRSWQVAHEFPAGAVRHVHGVQWDPVGGGIWVGTGDADDRSQLGFSLDGARTFRWVGQGSQRFRVCSVFFLPGAVVWSTDADTQDNRVLRWVRAAERVEVGPRTLPGPSYFAQALDADSGAVGLAELEASVFLLGPDLVPVRLLQWTLPSPLPSGPHPGVRLARGRPSERRWLHVNPLRTQEDEAAIYRVPMDAVRRRVAEGGLR
jgi:hypothetical protein